MSGRRPLHELTGPGTLPVLSVVLGPVSDYSLYSAGLDNDISIWDTRVNRILSRLSGHTDSISSIALSSDAKFLLSLAMDATLRIWNVQPYYLTNNSQPGSESSGSADSSRLIAMYPTCPNPESNLLKCGWSADSSLIVAGSADRCVWVWEAQTGTVRYRLPGHTGTVNQVCLHPTAPIIASAGSDKKIFFGQIS